MLGILLVHKETGLTSHDVVNEVRRRFNTRRVGHAGTLDPLASGILVVAVGAATRFLQYLPLEPKEYLAKIQFGRATSTYDAEGEVTAEHSVPEDLEERLQKALPAFLGRIEQLPPMYSAVKVQGKPLYKYARNGQELVREPRAVRIDAFEFDPKFEIHSKFEIPFRIVCSGGTYVRSLAHDLGEAVGCGAFLAGLKRVSVGRFSVELATKLADLSPANLVPLAEALPPMPLVPLTEEQIRHVQDGRAVMVPEPPEASFAALLDENGSVFAVARVHGNLLQPECVIPGEVMHGAV